MNKVPTLPRHLRRGEVLRFRRKGRLCLRVESGSLWVTVDGQLADIELDAGQSRVFDDGSTVLVSSLGGNAVLSELPLASHRASLGWRQRLQAWLHDTLRPAFFA